MHISVNNMESVSPSKGDVALEANQGAKVMNVSASIGSTGSSSSGCSSLTASAQHSPRLSSSTSSSTSSGYSRPGVTFREPLPVEVAGGSKKSSISYSVATACRRSLRAESTKATGTSCIEIDDDFELNDERANLPALGGNQLGGSEFCAATIRRSFLQTAGLVARPSEGPRAVPCLTSATSRRIKLAEGSRERARPDGICLEFESPCCCCCSCCCIDTKSAESKTRGHRRPAAGQKMNLLSPETQAIAKSIRINSDDLNDGGKMKQLSKDPQQRSRRQQRQAPKQASVLKIANSTRRLKRCPLPVPPPVVPLYKELALIATDISGAKNGDGSRATGIPSSSMVDISNKPDIERELTTVEPEPSWSGGYNQNWNDLGSFKISKSKSCQLTAPNETSASFIWQRIAGLSHSGSVSRVQTNSRTFSRKTCRLLERLRHKIIGNFVTSSETITTSDINQPKLNETILDIGGGKDCAQADGSATIESSGGPEPIEELTIYDTPEACEKSTMVAQFPPVGPPQGAKISEFAVICVGARPRNKTRPVMEVAMAQSLPASNRARHLRAPTFNCKFDSSPNCHRRSAEAKRQQSKERVLCQDQEHPGRGEICQLKEKLCSIRTRKAPLWELQDSQKVACGRLQDEVGKLREKRPDKVDRNSSRATKGFSSSTGSGLVSPFEELNRISQKAIKTFPLDIIKANLGEGVTSGSAPENPGRSEQPSCTAEANETINQREHSAGPEMGSSHSAEVEGANSSGGQNVTLANTLGKTQQKLRNSFRVAGCGSGQMVVKNGCYEEPQRSRRSRGRSPDDCSRAPPAPIKSLSIMTTKLIRNNSQKQTMEAQGKVKPVIGRADPVRAKHEGDEVDLLETGEQSTTTKTVNKIEENCNIKSSEMRIAKNPDDNINNNNNNKVCLNSNLERRRASIRNGDVFIYPSIYTDLNECHKCFRDKLICNCNDSITSISSSSSSSVSMPAKALQPLDGTGKNVNLLAGGEMNGERGEERKSPADKIHEHDLPKGGSPRRRPLPPVTRPRTTMLRDNKPAPALTNNNEQPESMRSCRPEVNIDDHTSRPMGEQRAAQQPKRIPSSDDSKQIVGNFQVDRQLERANAISTIQLTSVQSTENKSINPDGSREILVVPKESGSRVDKVARGPTFNMTQISVASRMEIHVAPNGPTSTENICQDNTSIVAIETISGRRKNLLSKLNKQPLAIQVEPGKAGAHDKPKPLDSGTPQEQQVIVLPTCLNIKPRSDELSGQPEFKDNESGNNSDAGNCDVFEYSPILSSVRDYINNFNAELQVQTATAAAGAISVPPETCLAITTSQSTIHKLTYTGEDSEGPLMNNSSVSSGGLVLSPMTVITRPTITDAVVPIVLENTTAFGLNSDSRSPQEGPESPKKSIFDGASKDEILEYLEDARERVPEILMAADDVMVINDNELLVVNQLEPNSPATPISIMDATEVLQSATDNSQSSVVCLESSSLESTPTNPADSNEFDRDPEQLKQHLRQIYKTSQLAESSRFSSGTETIDDENSSNLNNESGVNSLPEIIDSDFSKSISESLEPNSNSYSVTHSVFTDCKSLSSTTKEVSDSVDDIQQNYLTSGSGEKLPDKVNMAKIRLEHSSSFRRRGSGRNRTGILRFQHSNANENDVMRSLMQNTDNSTKILVARRKSASDETQQMAERNSALLMMQRYSNRDSLSSSSSSPPPSTSPSSSTYSSNPTSGNCSAASNFYASSSLSCSSPLLPINIPLASPNSNSLLNSMRDNFFAREINQSSLVSEPERDELGTHNLESIDESRDSRLDLSEFKENNFCSSTDEATTTTRHSILATEEYCLNNNELQQNKLSIIQENVKNQTITHKPVEVNSKTKQPTSALSTTTNKISVPRNLVSKTLHGHYATINRLNNYFMNRHPVDADSSLKIEFQCLDCDQFIDVDTAKMLSKTNDIILRVHDNNSETSNQIILNKQINDRSLSPSDLDKAYIAAMNGLPLCKSCEKKRVERKEIITEFVDTEIKYGSDLKIIHEEFYRPMQIAGLLSKDQINGVFLNLEELIMANFRFSNRLKIAIEDANSMGDTDYNTINIGKLFVESAEMLHTFESYCIRQGSAACLLARLAKERELLRIFLRVSQMENTLLRRMNLAAFLMVPVQRVTRYPLLLNRLYKVTAYHHKDREALRDAQLKVELHLEHINQQTKGVGATNKIWRRISSLSAPISNRRGPFNAEDMGYIKLRKTAMDMLKWDRDETQFIHSGRLNFSPLSEFLTRQKAKSTRYMASHALLIVLGKPNWKYRPDLVKSNLDSKLMTPTPGGNGIKETALLLFREKNGRFIPCRDPLFLSNCVLSVDCSQFNNDCSANPTCHHNTKAPTSSNGTNNLASATQTTGVKTGSTGSAALQLQQQQQQQRLPTHSDFSANDSKSNSIDSTSMQNSPGSIDSSGKLLYNSNDVIGLDGRPSNMNGDAISMSSLKSLPEENVAGVGCLSGSPPVHTSRSYSLASALPRTAIPISGCNNHQLTKSTSTTTSSSTIFNQLITKVNNYHNKQLVPKGNSSMGDSQNNINNSNQQNRSSPTTTTTTTTNSTIPVALGSGSLDSSSHVVAANEQIQKQEAPSLSSNSIGRNNQTGNKSTSSNQGSSSTNVEIQLYNHHYFNNHHQPYGDYEESFEIHDRLSKESLLLRADTPLKTRYWLQMIRYHAKDLGQWRSRRLGLANIMMMRQE